MPNFNLCSCLNPFHYSQFNANNDGDFILIYDGNSTLISRLTGTDVGPKSQYGHSHWYKKIISSTTNKMLIEFISDDIIQLTGFSASIQFTQLQSQMCESWLDMKKKNLQSPNYPNFYDNITSCNWLITVRDGYHIELIIDEFNVVSVY